jgi:hypothetical protein
MKPTARDWIISWPNLEALIAEGNSFRMLVAGSRQAWISYDAVRTELAVEIEQETTDLPRVLPQSISLQVGKREQGKQVLVLATENLELRRYFYDFSVEVLELTQHKMKSACEAVDEAWQRWGQLIEQQSVLSRERQVGLIGELQLLQRLSGIRGWSYAVDAWHRTARAEHDFCLERYDIEVKTTTADRRVHTIGSIDQLLPSPGRPLYLLSFQLAIAPRLAANSFSLASLVEAFMRVLEAEPDLQKLLKERLERAGWRQHHTTYYQTSFVARNHARLTLVDESFPRIVPETLVDGLGSVSSRIESVMYSIDVSDLGWQEGTAEFERVLP